MARCALRRCFFLLLLALIVAGAQSPSTQSPAGVWRTIDDKTGKDKSLVVIWEEGGKLYGKIEKLLDRVEEPDRKCIHCEGELKDKPLVGMQIFGGLKRDGGQWSGGKILDPENGKFYKCYLSLEESGRKLKVRGFIGISLLGRTQYWVREQ